MVKQTIDEVKKLKKELMPKLIEADETMDIIEFVRTSNQEGAEFWAYLKIPPSKHIDFSLAIQKGGSVNLLQFGEVVASGYGTDPDLETKEKMQNEYGCSDSFKDEMMQKLNNN